MPIRFPHRRADGTGVVELVLSLGKNNPDTFEAMACQWLSSFITANSIWEFFEHEFRPECVFVSTPTVFRNGEAIGIRLVLRDVHEKLWRDWMAIVLFPALKDEFPGVGLASISSPQGDD